MRSLVLSGLLFQVILLPSAVMAQPRGPDQGSPREQVVNGFERRAPQPGELLPDVALLDAAGKPVRLRELKGQPTVLVFGCLT